MSVNPEKEKAIELAMGAVERQFGKGSIMRLGKDEPLIRDIQVISTGSHLAGHRARRRRRAPRPHRRDLRPGVLRQDHALPARHRRGPEEGRHLRLHRRRARPGRGLRPQARGAHRRPAPLPAGHRRAGAGDRRDAGALRRHRRAGGRLGGRAGAQGRARGRDGRRAHGRPGAADEPGAAQAHRHHRQEPDLRHLHQPDPDEDRRDVRQSGDHHRRQRAEVLRQPAARHPPHRARSRTASRWSATGPGSRW